MRRILNIILILSLVIFSTGVMAKPAAQKKWTFLIFLNGDNSLDEEATFNLKQMESIGPNDDLNIIVQWASYERRKAVRLNIQKSTDPDNVTSPVIEDLGLTDMGDYHNLEDFLIWGMTNYPAEHYFVDVWNHGNGWLLKRRTGYAPIYKNISYDDISGNSITTEQLGQVMRNVSRKIGRKIDIYGSDACLMEMMEVANEMSDSVDYIVGSEELEPGEGWPYDKLLADWEANSAIDAVGVSKALVNDYADDYKTSNLNSTMSVLDAGKMAKLDESLKQLASDIHSLSSEDRKKVMEVMRHTYSFDGNYEGYKDLIDFLKKLKAEKIKSLSRKDIKRAIKNADKLVVASRASEHAQGSHGVSIWLPDNVYQFSTERVNRYQSLQFNLNTNWIEALTYLHQDDAV